MKVENTVSGGCPGQVLLKNAGRLPLKHEGIKKLALIGPHANGSIIFLGGPKLGATNRNIFPLSKKCIRKEEPV